MGNKFPELIFQNQYGIIQILNHKGVIIDQIATNNELRGLGTYNGKNVIIMDNELILFNDYKILADEKSLQNEWRYPFSTADNSRKLFIGEKIESKTFIMDLQNTYAYPNPSINENIIFRITFGNAESIDINIFDIAGFLITSFPIEVSNTNSSSYLNRREIKEVHWNVSDVDPGVYIAKVIARNGKNFDEKIIKVGLIK